MSFNITSDGSPTPRKGPNRFAMAGDLRIDTSPEVLGQAVGSMSLNQYPFAFQRAFGSPLTCNTQGMKRPLGPSTLGNQIPLQQHSSFDGYKVSQTSVYYRLTVTIFYSAQTDLYRSPRWKLTKSRLSWTRSYSG
jgi:hypothetical protein